MLENINRDMVAMTVFIASSRFFFVGGDRF
jgi:hypothetical protein